MKYRPVLVLWAMIFFLQGLAGTAGAQEPSFLTLRLVQSKPYYSSAEMLETRVLFTNSLPTSVKTGVIFELRGRSGLGGETDTPVIYRKAWSRYNLPPGASELKINKSLSSLKLSEGAYPIKISLAQAGQIINSASSVLVVLNDHPPQESFPVALVLIWPLHERARFEHRGVYLDNKIADDSSADPGSPGLYFRHVAAISQYPNLRVTMAVTPLLIEQMRDMKDGYRVAVDGKIETRTSSSKESRDVSAVFDRLAELFGSRELSLLPAPNSLAPLSYLADNGWDLDGRLQISRGLEVLNNALELGSREDSLTVPDFALGADSIGYLAEEGIQNTVLDESFFRKLLPEETEDPFKAYRLQDADGNRITAVFRDDKSSGALELESADEAVQRLMGRLAEVYLYQPQRQKIVVAAAGIQARPSQELLAALYSALQAPWVRTVTLREAIELAPPVSKPLMMADNPVEEGYLSGAYRKKLAKSRRLFSLFSQAVDADNPVRKRLERELLIAEGWDWTSSWDLKVVNLGLDFVTDVEKTVAQELDKIKVVPSEEIALSSLQGKIPVAVFSRADYPLKARISIRGKDFVFPQGSAKSVTIEPKENLFSFSLAATRAGTFPLKVALLGGSELIDEKNFLIKTTSLSRTLALVGAALVAGVALYFLLRFGVRAKSRSQSGMGD